ncbi:MAG: hypothetical protein B7C24_13370 [Bacteroidetes bacterium 4572_77]|nr:MAG: hypothetical protein B7C24_13370 [Bacteroidetes bacterium 4572_77]
MALYAYPENPGNWQTFVLRQDVKDLPVDQQRKKYLTEQLQYEDFISQQRYLQEMSRIQLNNQLRNAGGFATNPIISAEFNQLQAPLETLSGDTTQIQILFKEPITVDSSGGVPYIDVANDQLGGGTASTVRYTYYESSGNTNMRFEHDHSGGPQTDVPFAYQVGTGISDEGQNITADVIVAGGGTALSSITFKTSESAALYYPGNQLVVDAADIGAGGTGTVTVTLTANDLQGDTLTLVGTNIELNGALVYSQANGPDYPLDPTFESTSTLASSAI